MTFTPLNITADLTENEILRVILQVEVSERANQIMYALANKSIDPVIANNLLSLIQVFQRLSNLQLKDDTKI